MRREDKVRHKYSPRRPKAHAPVYERRNQFDSNALEKAFTEEWAKQCRPKYGGEGFGILDAIVNPPDDGKKWRRCRRMNGIRLTTTDCIIVASVIQWLGTNCGFAFLQSALAKDGWDIKAKPDRKRFDIGAYYFKPKPADPNISALHIAKVLKQFHDGRTTPISVGPYCVKPVTDYIGGHAVFRCTRYVINGDDTNKMTIYQCALEIKRRIREQCEAERITSCQGQ